MGGWLKTQRILTTHLHVFQYIYILGDITIECEEEAFRYQAKIEESLQYQMGFQLKIGDTILTHFDSLPGQNGGKRGRRRSKVFER